VAKEEKTVKFNIAPGEEIITACKAFGIDPAEGAPPRKEGDGPFNRLVLRNAMLIDGTGNPIQGPVNIVISKNRIERIVSATFSPPENGDFEIDCANMYVLPGFVDSHVHIANPVQGLTGKITPAEYVYKLWLAHGVTTVRECGALMGLKWTLNEERKSLANEITAPRIVTYPALYYPWMVTEVVNAEAAVAWVNEVAKTGITGIKLFGYSPEVTKALLTEARKRGLRSSCHHTVSTTSRVNALDSAKMGLTSTEHFLGLAEAISSNGAEQNYPYDYNFDDELMRVRQDANMWRKVEPYSSRWNETIETMIDLDFTIVPTLAIWEPGLDVMRCVWSEWHEQYTLPALWRYFQPNPMCHWSFYWDWTTADEISFKQAYQKWMSFVNDYKNRGGRITAGSDSGFGFKIFGFDFIREFEFLQEAGFHPLEVIRAATMKGAELLGMDKEIGTVEPGKKADLLVITENPLQNFKILYGTGHMRLNRATGAVERIKGLRWTIKDGIIYDVQKLLSDVRDMVSAEKKAEMNSK
jgi:hypothetical protein